MWSPTRKALGAGEAGYLGEWHGFRQYARNVTGPAAEQLYVWFEPDLTPGYAWSFPLPNGRANIGFGVLRDGERRIQSMKGLWEELLQRPHVREALGEQVELEDRHTAWPIPARIDNIALTCGRTLFVGDAAAATDVMTGEGIGQALLTGRLAAESILGAGAGQPDIATAAYERAVAHHLIADHRMSALLGRVLSTSWGARGALRVVASSGEWGRRNFARWMFEDEPRAILLTPGRWHRRMLAAARRVSVGLSVRTVAAMRRWRPHVDAADRHLDAVGVDVARLTRALGDLDDRVLFRRAFVDVAQPDHRSGGGRPEHPTLAAAGLDHREPLGDRAIGRRETVIDGVERLPVIAVSIIGIGGSIGHASRLRAAWRGATRRSR